MLLSSGSPFSPTRAAVAEPPHGYRTQADASFPHAVRAQTARTAFASHPRSASHRLHVRSRQRCRRRNARRLLCLWLLAAAIAWPIGRIRSAGRRWQAVAIRTASAPRTIKLTWLNGWPMHSPTDASPTPSRMPAHGLGPIRFAIPSS